MLAIAPRGDYHPGVPLDADEVQCRVGDDYWKNKVLPWIMQRTVVFKRMVPGARILELDSPEYRVFIALEEATAKVILDCLANRQD